MVSRRGGGSPEGFLPLKPRVFLMLLVLAQEPRHGYALKEELADRGIVLGPGTLYRTLHRLLGDGLIAECDDRPSAGEDDERRRYYQVTPLGRRVASAEAQRLAALVEAARAEGLIA